MLENEERLGKTLVDSVKSEANETFWNVKTKELREQIKSIEFTLEYFQYQIYCLNKKRSELMREYHESLGLEVRNESKAQA